jgi:hypothetical protein
MVIMVNPKETRTSVAADNARVHARNTIIVALEDLTEEDRNLTEEDRKEVEQDLSEEEKVSVLPKDAQQGVVKKIDTATASDTKVNSSLIPEDLAHMVDVWMASKYGMI